MYSSTACISSLDAAISILEVPQLSTQGVLFLLVITFVSSSSLLFCSGFGWVLSEDLRACGPFEFSLHLGQGMHNEESVVRWTLEQKAARRMGKAAQLRAIVPSWEILGWISQKLVEKWAALWWSVVASALLQLKECFMRSAATKENFGGWRWSRRAYFHDTASSCSFSLSPTVTFCLTCDNVLKSLLWAPVGTWCCCWMCCLLSPRGGDLYW